MALAKYGGVISELRGKEAGVVFSRNAYGSYMKQKVSPVNPQSSFQQAQRSKLGGVAQAWSGLTEAEKELWSQFGQQVVRVNRFGDQTNYTGFNAFVKSARNRTLIGLAPATSPVALPSFPDLTIVGVVFELGTPEFSVNFTPTPIGAGYHLVIEATPGIITGRRFFKNFYRLVLGTAANVAAGINIATDYEARFTTLPVAGSIVGVRVRIIHAASGWDTASQVASAVVTS